MEKRKALTILLMLVCTVTLLLVGDLGEMIDTLQEMAASNPWGSRALFIVLFLVVTITGLPGAALLTTTSGYLFGFAQGVALSLCSSVLSALLSFLLSRYLFREWFERRFATLVARVNNTEENDRLSQLFLLRLIPGIPFPLLNMCFGVTPIKAKHYLWVSALGLMPITLLLVNAGARLESVDKAADILSPTIIISLIALGALPITVRWGYKKWSPRSSQ